MRTEADTDPPAVRVGSATLGRRLFGLALLIAVVLFACIGSLAVGTKWIPLAELVTAFTDRDPTSLEHLIVRDLRQPRTLLGLEVGLALGAAGALMQGVTRNPLADPGLLGVNAGASFAVVVSLWLFEIETVFGLIWFAFLGAAVTSIVVYILGTSGRAGATPVRLALAGAAVAALLFALTRAITLIDQQTLDRFRFWAIGSLAGRGDEVASDIAPFVVIALLVAIGAARQFNALALGDDVAVALGVHVGWTRAVSVLGITLLSGAAVAAAGPVAFVGLVVPHATRLWFGPDHRWLLPASALAGAALLLFCDTLGRIVARPGEIQVGIMTAVLGGPTFIALVRRQRMVQL